MELLLEWIQAVTESYFIKIDTFASLGDGKALCCLLNYYFRHQVPEVIYDCAPVPLLDSQDTIAVHNFVLVLRVMATMGSFPEVLQVSDILDQDASFDERSVIILLVFLASQLLLQRKMDHVNIYQLFCSSYQSPNGKTSRVSTLLHCENSLLRNPDSLMLKFNELAEQDEMTKSKIGGMAQPYFCLSAVSDHSAKIIQSHFRGFMAHKQFLKIKTATQILQAVTRAWLAVTKKNTFDKVNHPSLGLKLSSESCKSSDIQRRYYVFMTDRQMYVSVKKSVLVIQKAVRAWISRRYERRATVFAANPSSEGDRITTSQNSHLCKQMERSSYNLVQGQVQENEAIFDDSDFITEGQELGAVKIQHTCRSFILSTIPSQEESAATIIQSHWRGWLTKRLFLSQMRAIVKIQNELRSYHSRKEFKLLRLAAIAIQQAVRGQTARNRLLGASCHRFGNSHFRSCDAIQGRYGQYKELRTVIYSIHKLQSWWRQILLLKLRTQSVICIQSCIRGFFWRNQATRVRRSVVIIQKWWRDVLFVRLRERSVLIIQSHVRGWITRQEAARERHRIAVIQAYWKGCLVRRCAKKQLVDLRSRIQKSAANVDDDMRLINRLLSAVSLLLSHKSISNIRHTCSTINMATEHSQTCCETLVDAGTIDILLKEIRRLTRSGPDQEVLKEVLSILRNIVRYPILARKLISTPQSVEVIFREFLRNKTEGYFVASELLRKLFAIEEGRKVVRTLQCHVRRLHILIQELERKVDLQKRNARNSAARGDLEQRLKAAQVVLQSALGTYS